MGVPNMEGLSGKNLLILSNIDDLGTPISGNTPICHNIFTNISRLHRSIVKSVPGRGLDGICSSGGRNSGGVPQRNAPGALKTCRFCCVFFVSCLLCHVGNFRARSCQAPEEVFGIGVAPIWADTLSLCNQSLHGRQKTSKKPHFGRHSSYPSLSEPTEAASRSFNFTSVPVVSRGSSSPDR